MIKKIVHSLDSWLWHRGLHHPAIRAIALAECCLSALALVAGIAACAFSLWPASFALGVWIFAGNFYGLARFMLRQSLTAYSSGLLMLLLLRFGGRLLLTAVILYVALIVYHASVVALVCGLVAGMTVALVTYALTGLAGHKRKEA